MAGWVDPQSPEGFLKRAQERYDQAWEQWWETRSPGHKERLDHLEQELSEAKLHVEWNNAATNVRCMARSSGL
jgi:hypothetical protein